MNDAINAADPKNSACVLASAGTGKTWLLVARLVRLLMAGATPDKILAITFTRKAAGEMQVRLQEKLGEFIRSDDKELDALLSEIGEFPTKENRIRARSLFESVLFSEQPLRTTTFHSFCHDLLTRFPLEANLPPGFELTQTTGLLFEQSWDALFTSATQNPSGKMAERLNRLFRYFASAENTRTALLSFFQHRGDWWAYTHNQKNPALYAEKKLASAMKVKLDENLARDCLTEKMKNQLLRFSSLLNKHPIVTNLKNAARIEHALEIKNPEDALATLKPAFLTAAGQPLARKSTNILEEKLGKEIDEFLTTHQEICSQIIRYHDEKLKIENFRANADWYHCGTALLENFQTIKRNRRLVDFVDLEWKAHQLLNHSEHAQWVHYKLDQRIDHLLIDEFQDTNPTQWQLLQPLIEEIATNNPDEPRSLFLVGDAKQAIYRFRRGNPALLGIASDHMTQQLGADAYHMDTSWRSSPAIMDAVNRIFSNRDASDTLSSFATHQTHLKDLWGYVEILPLDMNAPTLPEITQDQDLEFRNPLAQPRVINTYNPYSAEANSIAQRIAALIENRTAIGSPQNNKVIDYNDIIILLRSRTHLADYELALREQDIPYLSMDRGTLLKSLEVRDIESLLNVLMTPENNLALAQVLRSPIFSATEDDLILLAKDARGAWMDQLGKVSTHLDAHHPLARANELLGKWKKLAGHIPIHDLLDKIYHDTNLITRYLDAFPASLQPRVSSNLTSFIELALSVDSGRYPSLPHFLDRLRKLRRHSDEAPDEAPATSKSGQRVRIMTIHAAKGLEAPIVFLADCAKRNKPTKAYSALVDWPAEADKPTIIMLTPGKTRSDSWNSKYLERERELEEKDSANLLYVALTRAKQMLFISGSQSGTSQSTGWYSQISAALCNSEQQSDETIKIEHGKQPKLKCQAPTDKQDMVVIDRGLSKSFSVKGKHREIAPSRQSIDTYPSSESGQLFGQAIHRFLQLKMDNQKSDIHSFTQQIQNELQLTKLVVENAETRVAKLIKETSLQWIFTPDKDTTAWNEVPIEYPHKDRIVTGFMDRLLVNENETHVIDYKSHEINSDRQLRELTEKYRDQMTLYRIGVQKIWPGKTAKSWLLFTSIAQLVEVN